MRKFIISISVLLIIPATMYAGFSFGLIQATQKTGEKVDEKVVGKKAIIAAQANHQPIIVSLAANPASISTGAVTTITCVASDTDGDTLSYSWSAGSGTITGSGASVTWTSPLSSATYTITCTVADGKGGTASRSMNVVVTRNNNSPVIATLSASPATISTGAVTTITCVASDADGDTLSYSWSAGSGTITGSGASVTWTSPLSSATYTINCTVTDGKGGTALQGVDMIVSKNNNSPVITSLSASPATILASAVTTITCAASDVDDDTLNYNWSAGSGTISGSGAFVTWTAPASSGSYTIDVSVTDGNAGTASQSVNVMATNNSPVIISLSASPTTISTGAVTTITCAASDADDNTLNYSWSAGSGTITGTGASVTWTSPALSSNYTINATVTDGNGGATQASVNLVVNNPPIITMLSASPSTISTGAVTTITCAASDADGDNLNYNWSAGSGTITGSGTSVTWTSPVSSGTYSITCTITDGKDGTALQSMSIYAGGHELPDTGQTLSYTSTFGEDNDYQSVASQPSYTDNGDGTTTDNKTGLMWVKDGNSAGCNNGGTSTWAAALNFCEGLTYAGYSNWRLPNIRELESIVDAGQSSPAINMTYFPNTKSLNYWTSTTYVPDTSRAWIVTMYGLVFTDHKSPYFGNYGDNYIRCVRAGP